MAGGALEEGDLIELPVRWRVAAAMQEVDISVPFDWNATPAEVTERVRTAMND